MISIVINTKNEVKNLPRLLKSIFKSSAQPQEIILVDNHSTDLTQRLARDIFKNYMKEKMARNKFSFQIQPYSASNKQIMEGNNFLQRTTARLKAWLNNQTKKKNIELNLREQKKFIPLQKISLYIFTKGPERSSQKNFGANQAKGRYLLFLDADMEVSKNLLQELQRLVRQSIDCAIIPEQSIGHDFWGNAAALERNCYQGEPLIEAPRFIKRDLFLKLGGFDENLIAAEDWDLWQRLQKHNPVHTKTTATLLHHEPKGLANNLQRKWYYTQHINQYARKHPLQFAKQSSLTTRLKPLWRNKVSLIQKPIHTFTFLTIKILIYLKWKQEKTRLKKSATLRN